jgi:K+-transporting ATPase ATPase C chain
MRELLTSLRLVLLSMGVCCVMYTAALLAFGQAVVPDQAEGSLVRDAEGRIVGSSRIAQGFTRAEYFWPRPSAVNYDAAGTGGSNLSPANPKVTDRARAIIERLAPREGERVPADLVTTSGSGIDPHISQEAARFQVPRVAAARGRPAAEIEALIRENLQAQSLRVFGGEPVVNVLELNLALDRAREE